MRLDLQQETIKKVNSSQESLNLPGAPHRRPRPYRLSERTPSQPYRTVFVYNALKKGWLKALFSNQRALLIDNLREQMISVASVNMGKFLHAIAVRLSHAK